jgi:GNAT superfamily N-acetyltransferase
MVATTNLAPEITLRPATPGDCGALAALLLEAFAHYGDARPQSLEAMTERLRRHLGAAPGYEAILAECDGTAIGFAIYAPVFWTSDCEIGLFLKEIFIVTPHRGRGVGRAIMGALARVANERGWTRIVWTVDRRNKRGLRFYDRLNGARGLDKNVYMIAGRDVARLASR